jgi:hypothetical protein
MRHFSVRYLAHNIYIYYFHPPDWTKEFPFLAASAVRGGPEGYLGGWNEAICGIGITFPFLWLAFVLPLFWQTVPAAPHEAPLRASLIAILFLHLAMAGAVLTYFVATPRYLADFTPTLALLAACGWLGLERWSKGQRFSGIVASLSAVSCLVTVIAGVLVSADYHNRSLRSLSPHDWQNIEKVFQRLLLK